MGTGGATVTSEENSVKLVTLRICNFQSFGPDPKEIKLDSLTYVLGPNGSGKTAVLQALVRMFGIDQSQRRVQKSDFHVPIATTGIPAAVESPELWLEADFEWEEASDTSGAVHPTVPPFFAHMQLSVAGEPPRVRIRLTATLDTDEYIDEKVVTVIEADTQGTPIRCVDLPRRDRSSIQVHYLPARRDPADHISYAAASLLGRALRAANWTAERSSVATLTEQISDALVANTAVTGIGTKLQESWSGLHTGTFFSNPIMSFGQSEIDNLLRHMSITFSPSPINTPVDYTRLSDGQKSLLYISLVLALQSIGREVLEGKSTAFDPDKLRPAAFTLIAVEEPENSLAPQYLGRIVKALREACIREDVQALIATHSPSLMKRVPPENVRFLRLNEQRATTVREIVLPEKSDVAHKYVREAVLAFPELYFSRLVVLGEGDSEVIVLPRILAARGIAEDDASVVVVPLGGRHVNHFWRLLHDLEIPHVTLLDLDFARFGGGWGRIRNVANKLLEYSADVKEHKPFTSADVDKLPKWDEPPIPPEGVAENGGKLWKTYLEDYGVYFSGPLDLDILMLTHYPEAYGIEDASTLPLPDDATRKHVLGKARKNEEVLGDSILRLFDTYHSLFDLDSKPASHLSALAALNDAALLAALPPVLDRMATYISTELAKIPE
ncbi:ATP-dependent endonuclease [Rhodococcus sp. NPDC057135]|uniref:ATP-dependent nuclease n=1 Tax=Rhodococcus sp. NPDC057135 TaxID=3346028 RepID=UPI003626636E